jgi:hypothetical protein
MTATATLTTTGDGDNARLERLLSMMREGHGYIDRICECLQTISKGDRPFENQELRDTIRELGNHWRDCGESVVAFVEGLDN